IVVWVVKASAERSPARTPSKTTRHTNPSFLVASFMFFLPPITFVSVRSNRGTQCRNESKEMLRYCAELAQARPLRGTCAAKSRACGRRGDDDRSTPADCASLPAFFDCIASPDGRAGCTGTGRRLHDQQHPGRLRHLRHDLAGAARFDGNDRVVVRD